MKQQNRISARLAGIALAAGGLLALPGICAADIGPTISQVLDNSGIFAAGYLAAGYTGSFNKGQTLSARVFDSDANTFELNQAALILAHLPDEGFGGKAVIIAGSDAKVLNAFYGSGSSDFALFIAYAQYSTGPFNVIAGRFPALSGAELAPEPLNTNISRSLALALTQPVPLTGIRFNYVIVDGLTATVSVTNSDNFGGAAALADQKSKAIEAGFAYVPFKGVKIAAYNYFFKADAADNGKNDIVDLVASWKITPALELVFNGDYKRMFDTISTTTTTTGPLGLPVTTTAITSPESFALGGDGYINYQFDPQWSASLRLEALQLKNEAATISTELQEATITGRYSATKNLRLLAEFRTDHSSSPYFADGPALAKHDSELEATAIYAFGL